MTTFPGIPESKELEDALTLVIGRLGTDREAVRAVAEMRSASSPGNGFTVAAVPWGPVRARIAAALRSVAAGGHPLAAQLEGMAGGLAPGTAPGPPPVPVPAAAPAPEPPPVPEPAVPPVEAPAPPAA